MNKPNFRFEKKLWKRGFKIIAGMDEVGRGCFAGPVVAAAVAFAPQIKNSKLKIKNSGIEINDSKKLKPRQRGKAADWIKNNSLTWGIGEAPASLINRIGVAKATKIAFRIAIASANSMLKTKGQRTINYLLIDAFYIPYVKGLRRKNQLAIVDGDEKSLTIAAASIVAKVYRDRLMRKLSRKYPQYGWGRNKGYGTEVHREAIVKFGVTRYHRRQFVATFFNNSYASLTRSGV